MKTILTFMMLLFTSVSMADTITLLNNGKAGGSYNARTQIYKEGLQAKGFTVVFENIGKISQAVKMFKETSKPTIMVYSNNQVHLQDLYHDENNFIMLEYQQPLYICITNEAKIKGSNLKVAHGKGYDKNLIKSVLSNDIVLVPYKNSGAMLKGILGGDVDAMVNNQDISLKYMASGEGTCEVSEKLPIMMATVIGTNVDLKSMREILFEISLNKQFAHYHDTKKLDRSTDTWSIELLRVKESERLWTK